MNDGFTWWLIVLGIAIGVGLVWVFVVRLPRSEDDVGESEREAEAAWISRTIETYGGVAPQALVDEVLELHGQYLDGGGVAAPGADRTAEPGPSTADEHVSGAQAPLRRVPAPEIGQDVLPP